MAGQWQASAARNDFEHVVEAAVNGEPQFIRRGDGREVVMVSREYFEKTRPSLKSFLLTAGVAEGEDGVDLALQQIRAEASPFIVSEASDLPE